MADEKEIEIKNVYSASFHIEKKSLEYFGLILPIRKIINYVFGKMSYEYKDINQIVEGIYYLAINLMYSKEKINISYDYKDIGVISDPYDIFRLANISSHIIIDENVVKEKNKFLGNKYINLINDTIKSNPPFERNVEYVIEIDVLSAYYGYQLLICDNVNHVIYNIQNTLLQEISKNKKMNKGLVSSFVLVILIFLGCSVDLLKEYYPSNEDFINRLFNEANKYFVSEILNDIIWDDNGQFPTDLIGIINKYN